MLINVLGADRCIQGRYEDADYAIFQCKTIHSTSDDNAGDLRAELELMVLGGYFLSSMYRRAAVHSITLPCTFMTLPSANNLSTHITDCGSYKMEF